ncbi:MAG: aspartate racemase [uncultured bacterium]|nr:MAG: aspartate racemase [uncultured bacterium]
MNKYKTIGIIGGQGPSSTADFYMRIVKYYQDNFGAGYVRDFPPMIIFSVPTPDLVEGIQDEEKTFMMIVNAIKKMERDGCDFIVIACNSLQYLNKKLQDKIKIPIIGISPIIAEYIKNKGYKTVGILATNTTIKKKIYDSDIQKNKIKLITPKDADQNNLIEVILNEFSGKTSAKDKEILKTVAKNLQKDGADAILLACTEFPMILKQQDLNIPLIDCNEVYAQKSAQLSNNL